MKKQLLLVFSLVVISAVTFYSCEPFIQNKITIKNLAAETVHLSIRGQLYDILPDDGLGKSEFVILNDYKKGTFAYSTTYDVPFGIKTSSAVGAVSGEMTLLAGTEISLVYTSVVDSTKYTLYGILSSSDDVNRVDPFGGGVTP